MTPKNKKSKVGVVVLLVCALSLSLFTGYYIGNNSAGTGINTAIKNIFNINADYTQTLRPDGESIITLNPVPETLDGGYDTTEIFEKVNPSVVSINVYSGNAISPISSGTGIIMTSDGYIVTNAHVVSGGTSVNVILNDETQIRGTVIGADEDTDIAVVKVDRTGLTAAEFGDSTTLKIGERAIAIGNAGGLSSTLTQGVISGLNRDLQTGGRTLKLVQTSAAINPGNSGGPLVNRFGQVVGITSSKVADVSYEGIGFAIPIAEALPIIDSLIEYGYVTGRAVLGIQVISLNDSNGPRNGLPSKGLYIAAITEGSDLPIKGVRERDVILEANGTEMLSTDDLLKELEKCSPGEMFNLKMFRPETNQTYSVDVLLIESK